MTVLSVWKGGAQCFVRLRFVRLQTAVGISPPVAKRLAFAAMLWNVYEFTI